MKILRIFLKGLILVAEKNFNIRRNLRKLGKWDDINCRIFEKGCKYYLLKTFIKISSKFSHPMSKITSFKNFLKNFNYVSFLCNRIFM